MSHLYTNQLVNETSPYLLQHAHNPVNWHPWGPEAVRLAREQNVVGARGPEGYQWPIPYLLPFSDAWQLTWSGQWFLNAWPNFLITGVLLLVTFYLAWKRGFSPLEMLSARADQALVQALRQRFGRPGASKA